MVDKASREAVRETFDQIAPHFARTRTRPWEQVTAFLEGGPSCERGLDLGCANGRHLDSLSIRCRTVVGIDFSRELLNRAREVRSSGLRLIQGDATTIPLRRDTIDTALFIATIHHLPSDGLRVKSLDELDRVLRTDAPVLVSTWSVSHDRFDEHEPGDHLIPWTLPTGERLDRYYHLFDLASFRHTLQESALGVERVWEEDGNCWAVACGS